MSAERPPAGLSRTLPPGSEWVEYIRAGLHRERAEFRVADTTKRMVAAPDDLSRNLLDHWQPESSSFFIDGKWLSEALGRGGRDLQHEFHDLGAEFAPQLAPLLNELRIQSGLLVLLADSLNTLEEGLGSALDTTTRRRWTEARELYVEGCAKAAEMLFPEALDWLVKADDRYPTDFLIQFELGWVYLYGVSEEDDVVDLAKAEGHLRRAVRYGKGAVRRRPDMAAPTAEAALHLSLACALQALELQRAGGADWRERLAEAVDLVTEATKVNPRQAQGCYLLAKYSALLGRREAAVAALASALGLDRRFALTLDTDADLESVWPGIERLLESLRVQAGDRTEAALARLERLGELRGSATELGARRAMLAERYGKLTQHAALFPADFVNIAGVALEVRTKFDTESRTLVRLQEKASRLFERAERALVEVEALSGRAQAMIRSETLYAYQDVLPLAVDAAIPLKRAAVNLGDARQMVEQSETKLAGLDDLLPELAAEAFGNRAALRRWRVREALDQAVKRLPRLALGGALAGILVRIVVYFATGEFNDVMFPGLLARAALFAGLGGLAGVLAAAFVPAFGLVRRLIGR